MILKLIRKYKNNNCTIGELFVDDKKLCDTLEDVDRGLTSDMTLDQINKIKINTKTAIPTGTYQIIINMSQKFKRLMPELLNVTGFEGIRIHAGNTDTDTEGCILLGEYVGGNSIVKSQIAVGLFMSILQQNIIKQKVFIKII